MQAWYGNIFKYEYDKTAAQLVDQRLATTGQNYWTAPGPPLPQVSSKTYDYPTLRRDYKLYYLTPDDVGQGLPINEAQALNAVRQEQAQDKATSTRYQTTSDREIGAGTIKGLAMFGADPFAIWDKAAKGVIMVSKGAIGAAKGLKLGAMASKELSGLAILGGFINKGKDIKSAEKQLSLFNFGGEVLDETAIVAKTIAEGNFNCKVSFVKNAEQDSKNVYQFLKENEKGSGEFWRSRPPREYRPTGADDIGAATSKRAYDLLDTGKATPNGDKPELTQTVSSHQSPLTDERGVGKKINGAADDVAEVRKGLNDNLYDGNFQGLVVTEHTGADGLLIRKINDRPIPQWTAPTEESIQEFLGHNLGFDITKIDPKNLTPEQEAFVRLGPSYHDGFTMESFFHNPPDRQGQLIIDPRLLSGGRKQIAPAEIVVAEYLASLGNKVECHFYSGNLKMGDFLVNGVRVELKLSLISRVTLPSSISQKKLRTESRRAASKLITLSLIHVNTVMPMLMF